jgi:hypothetical protein
MAMLTRKARWGDAVCLVTLLVTGRLDVRQTGGYAGANVSIIAKAAIWSVSAAVENQIQPPLTVGSHQRGVRRRYSMCWSLLEAWIDGASGGTPSPDLTW